MRVCAQAAPQRHSRAGGVGAEVVVWGHLSLPGQSVSRKLTHTHATGTERHTGLRVAVALIHVIEGNAAPIPWLSP